MTIPKLRMLDTSRTTQDVPVRTRSRGIPPALEQYQMFSSNIIRESESGLEQLFGPHRLKVAGKEAAAFSSSLYAAKLREITFAYVDYRVPVEITCEYGCKDYSFFMPTNGRGTFRIAGNEYESSTVVAVVTPVGQRLVTKWDADSPHLVVRISRSLFERQLSKMIGRSLHIPIVFAPTMSLITETSWRLHGALQLLHEEIHNHDSISAIGDGVTALEEFIAATFLLVHDSNYSEMLRNLDGQSESRSLRRAKRFIESHLAEELAIPDIACSVNLSIRTLQKSFKDELGTTPLTYVRDLRLERVRRVLEDAGIEDDISISLVARQWCFHHYGRFATAYKNRYGETPSETLAR